MLQKADVEAGYVCHPFGTCSAYAPFICAVTPVPCCHFGRGYVFRISYQESTAYDSYPSKLNASPFGGVSQKGRQGPVKVGLGRKGFLLVPFYAHPRRGVFILATLWFLVGRQAGGLADRWGLCPMG